MHKFTAIILLFAVLISTYNKCFVYAGYKINQKYIASLLCENRKNPELHCNGNCFLMKKIKQANDKEKNNEAEFKKNNAYEALISTILSIHAPFVKFTKLVFKNLSFSYPEKSNFIFQPPQA